MAPYLMKDTRQAFTSSPLTNNPWLPLVLPQPPFKKLMQTGDKDNSRKVWFQHGDQKYIAHLLRFEPTRRSSCSFKLRDDV